MYGANTNSITHNKRRRENATMEGRSPTARAQRDVNRAKQWNAIIQSESKRDTVGGHENRTPRQRYARTGHTVDDAGLS